MIENTTHSSIGCNGMANNDDYHGLEMYKNHAKDSTTEGYMQPDPTNMECMWPNQSLKGQGNAPSEVRIMGDSRTNEDTLTLSSSDENTDIPECIQSTESKIEGV